MLDVLSGLDGMRRTAAQIQEYSLGSKPVLNKYCSVRVSDSTGHPHGATAPSDVGVGTSSDRKCYCGS